MWVLTFQKDDGKEIVVQVKNYRTRGGVLKYRPLGKKNYKHIKLSIISEFSAKEVMKE